jgi:hypothetical protein
MIPAPPVDNTISSIIEKVITNPWHTTHIKWKPHPEHPKPKPQPYLIYDSTIPASIPSGKVDAVYADGWYAASPSQLPHPRSTLWIDITGADPSANVLDIERGGASIAEIQWWVSTRLDHHPHAIAVLYMAQHNWPLAVHEVDNLPGWMQNRVQYWIADPTGVPHILPGAAATQWEWDSHYDISSAQPWFNQ